MLSMLPYQPLLHALQLVFNTGTKNLLGTWIRIQMTTSISVGKSVSISMISVPATVGIYYLFRLFSHDFLQIFEIFYLFFSKNFEYYFIQILIINICVIHSSCKSQLVTSSTYNYINHILIV